MSVVDEIRIQNKPCVTEWLKSKKVSCLFVSKFGIPNETYRKLALNEYLFSFPFTKNSRQLVHAISRIKQVKRIAFSVLVSGLSRVNSKHVKFRKFYKYKNDTLKRNGHSCIGSTISNPNIHVTFALPYKCLLLYCTGPNGLTLSKKDFE